MPVKHSTIPVGVDKPGFAGVTPSIWAQQHAFSGGSQGAVLTYNTNNSDNLAFTGSASGFLLSSGTNALPTFTPTVPFPTIFAQPISITTGYVEIASFVPVSQINRLVNNAGTLQWNGNVLASGSSLSGTANTVALFTTSSSVGNSIMTQSGTTITVANTLAATTVTATTLTGTLSTASQTNITGVGTITTGTWQATAVDVTHGGTGSNLSGTGGVSQFLRQNSVGAAVTVIRPAVADLSDGTHVIVDTGSYADPSWLTSLSGAKITGANSVSDSVLSANIPLLNGTASHNTFTGGDLRVNGGYCYSGNINQCFQPGSGSITSSSGATRFTTDLLVTGTTSVSANGGVNLGTDTGSPAVNADVNDYNVETNNKATLIRIGGNAVAHNITGISNHGADGSGRFFWLVNFSGATLTLKHDSGSSAVGNRFYCPGAADFALGNFKSVQIIYSAPDSHWIVLASA